VCTLFCDNLYMIYITVINIWVPKVTGNFCTSWGHCKLFKVGSAQWKYLVILENTVGYCVFQFNPDFDNLLLSSGHC
jgi:hypothetical protein